MPENTRQQGARGVAMTVAHYGALGHVVYVPVSGDISRCDLIVDLGPEKGLIRVEVKTTTRDTGEVGLRTMGGNRNNNTIKRLSAVDCDVVMCVNLNTGTMKEFQIQELQGRNCVRVR